MNGLTDRLKGKLAAAGKRFGLAAQKREPFPPSGIMFHPRNFYRVLYPHAPLGDHDQIYAALIDYFEICRDKIGEMEEIFALADAADARHFSGVCYDILDRLLENVRNASHDTIIFDAQLLAAYADQGMNIHMLLCGSTLFQEYRRPVTAQFTRLKSIDPASESIRRAHQGLCNILLPYQTIGRSLAPQRA